jgi:hypothetical protein
MELFNRQRRSRSAASFSPVSLVHLPLAPSIEEDRLAEAEVRLQQAKVEAILGIRYDADEYDRIVAEYRSAKRLADSARAAARLAAAPPTKGAPIPFPRAGGTSASRLAA